MAASGEQHSFQVPLPIRLFFRYVSPILPGLATRFALKLFFAPIPYPIPKREKPFRKEAKAEPLPFQAEDLDVFVTGTGPETVVLVHGWSGRGSQFFELAEFLAASGYRVVTFDAPGHGNSAKKRSEMPLFVEVLLLLEKRYGPIHMGIGHSLGGVALANAMNRGLPLQKLVMIGSPATISQVTADFCTRVEAPKRVFNGIMNFLRKTYQIEPDTLSSVSQVQQNPIPGLLVYDEDDRDVDLSEGQQLAKAWPNSALVVTRGLGHRRILRSEEVHNRILAFLKG